MNALINEVPIAYEETGSPDAVPVIFLHGFPFSRRMWSAQMEAVGKKYRAIAYDIRGHGESFVGDGQFTVEGHVDDLIGLLDFLKIKKTVICGLSMGGYITLRALERNPDRFIGAILCDTRSDTDTNEGKIGRANTAATVKRHNVEVFAAEFVKKVFAAETQKTKPEVVDMIRSVISHTSPLSIAGSLIALAARTDTTASLPKIAVPTLIVVGEHDITTPPECSRAMHEKIRGSELQIVPHAAHMSALENPEFVNAAMMKFLEKIKQ